MMKEARIECNVALYRIDDLDLDMARGEVRLLDVVAVAGSGDLKRAAQNKAVTLTWVERAKEVRPPKSAEAVGRPRPAPALVVPTKPTPGPLTGQDIRRIVREENALSRAELLKEIALLLEPLKPKPRGRPRKSTKPAKGKS